MKTVRNDSCSCGSGKKFKKCCIDLNIGIDNPDYPSQIFGYDQRISSDPLCVVSNITPLNKASIEQDYKAKFPIGSWFISFGSHDDIMLYGPYNSMDYCMQLGAKAFPDIIFKFPSGMLGME
eukprot:gnl/Carplike_NY0171/3676_a4961_188.p3 GENE.gnl/Carplike_NY0171/3676_a4961_188~~gnl/Carplike_NY0171/3676_a4961_188.p3  ORF type:complete len:122 (+),score=0.41 gnl/Carplike_NY0171/3676_a4961_188:447-812(+)